MDGKIFCQHCHQYLVKKSFIRHKRLYYDSDADQWIKKRCTDMFDFEEDPELCADETAFQISHDGSNVGCSSNEVDCIPPPLVELDEEVNNFGELLIYCILKFMNTSN